LQQVHGPVPPQLQLSASACASLGILSTVSTTFEMVPTMSEKKSDETASLSTLVFNIILETAFESSLGKTDLF
jgi:hypothetical protein